MKQTPNEAYKKDGIIREGTDITRCYYSDRACYHVTEVKDQKHIKVREYHVCADHSKAGGMGHQDWLYFKTYKEMNDYLADFYPNQYSKDKEFKESERDVEWVFRYGKWNAVRHYEDGSKRYLRIDERLIFGARNYYYDWSF